MAVGGTDSLPRTFEAPIARHINCALRRSLRRQQRQQHRRQPHVETAVKPSLWIPVPSQDSIMALAGRTLFITGASRGIGLAIALRYAVLLRSPLPRPRAAGDHAARRGPALLRLNHRGAAAASAVLGLCPRDGVLTVRHRKLPPRWLVVSACVNAAVRRACSQRCSRRGQRCHRGQDCGGEPEAAGYHLLCC